MYDGVGHEMFRNRKRLGGRDAIFYCIQFEVESRSISTYALLCIQMLVFVSSRVVQGRKDDSVAPVYLRLKDTSCFAL